MTKPVSVLAFVGGKDPLQPFGYVNASVTNWRQRLGHTDTPVQSFANASTTCSYTKKGEVNVTMCTSSEGKCATHAYANGRRTGQYNCPAEIHTTEQVLEFFATFD